MKRVLIFTCGVLLVSTLLFAQRQSGAIEGVVQDTNGDPISGVTITASSPSLIGSSSTTTTDRNGFYRFPVLPSGIYEVTPEHSGFQTLIRKNISISVGLTLKLDFSLEIKNLSEVVEVIEKPPLIDVSSAAVSFTVPAEIIHNLPRTQNIQNLLALTPGVDDELVAYGADGAKANTISIDGVTMSDSRASSAFDPRNSRVFNGFPPKLVIVDYSYNWIEEASVTGIGAPAEYGGFTGVAGNFVTRSGGNQFHGLFETFFQNEKLTSRNTPNPRPERPFQSYDVSAQLGGPIIRDKFWFFTGLQIPYQEIQPFEFDGVITDSQNKFISKLTYKINQDHTLHGFVNRNTGLIENDGAAFNVLPEATTTTRNSQWSGNASWVSLLGLHTTFEARYGGLFDNYYNDEDAPDVSGHYDLASGITSGNALARFSSKRVRHQVNAIFSHYASDFMKGDHDFRFGVQFERSHSEEEYNFNGIGGYYDYMGAPYTRYILQSVGAGGSNHRISAFAQDEWDISDQLTLSLGVRWDHNRGLTDRGTVFATDPVAPRIGLVWMFSKENQTVIKAHYGDYYEALLERSYNFLSDRINALIIEAPNSSGQWEEVFRNSSTRLSDDHLKQPFVRQFSIGVDSVLPGDIPFGTHYIYRKFGNILEDVGIGPFIALPFVNPLSGETIIVFDRLEPEEELLFTNPAGLYRRYDGLELFASRQFSRKFLLSGSLVYSRLRGNSPGDVNWPGTITPFLNDPNTLINFPGRLKNDPSIAWKIVGSLSLPLGINTGIYFRHLSGDTWTPTVRVPILQYVDDRINAEPVGSRRLPSENLLDLRVEKEFLLYDGQLRFTLDMFNVFNSAYPRRIQTQVEQPNFGMPVVYNQPRQMRIGIRYSF